MTAQVMARPARRGAKGCRGTIIVLMMALMFLLPAFLFLVDTGPVPGTVPGPGWTAGVGGNDGTGNRVGRHPVLMPPQDPSHGTPEPEYLMPGGSRDTTAHSRVSGDQRTVVVPVEFQDVEHFSSSTVQNLYNRSFSDGSKGPSLNSYYTEVSGGDLWISGNVTPWVKSLHNMSEYGEDGGDFPDMANGPIYRLVTEAVELVDPLVDFSEFDGDGDGTVDNIIVVHAGQAQEGWGGSEDDIWSHHWGVLDANLSRSGTQMLMADGVRIYSYSMVSEISPVGTWAHEFGHELGLPDLYDTDGSSYGIGKWGIMGSGSWNGGGNSPAHPCAWSKMVLGWISPMDVLAPMPNMTIRQAETTGEVYRLWIGDPDTSREYFLLENRQQVGFDSALPGSGLLIWHVDETRTSNTDDIRRLVDLEESDEENSGDKPIHSGDPWSQENLGFGQFSVPNSNGYNGQPSGWTVKDIGPTEANMTITIDVIADDVGVAFLLFDRYVNEGEEVDVEVHVLNTGINDQEDVPLEVTVTSGTRMVDDVLENIDSIDSKDMARVTITFTAETQGNYLITASTLMEGDQAPENDENAAILHVTTIIFEDDVESGENGWEHWSSVPQADLWKVRHDGGDSTGSSSPHHSWFCGIDQPGGGAYVPYTTYTLERTIELDSVTDAFLIFSHRYDLSFSVQNKSAPISDTGTVEIRTNLDADFTELDVLEGTSSGWGTDIHGLKELVDRPLVTNITVRFTLETDLLRISKGWWIDDIIVVGQWSEHDVAVLFNDTLVSADPGETRTVGITLWNSGSVEDTYQLTGNGPPFWDVDIPIYELTVDSLRSRTVSLTFRVDTEALAGDDSRISVTAISKGDSTVSRKTELTVVVLRTYGLEVEGQPDVLADPGGIEMVTFNVTNEGNGPETVTLNVSGEASVWADLPTTVLDLDPFETREVGIEVDLPLQLEAGEGTDLDLKAASNNGLDDTGHVWIEFARYYDLALEGLDPGAEVTPGGKVDLRFRLSNLGNGPENVALEYISTPGIETDGYITVGMGAWENATQVVEVEVSEDTPLSDFVITVRATSKDGVTERELELDIRVVLPDPAITSLEVSKTYLEKGENVTIAVVVTNEGTGTARDVMVAFFDNGDNIRTLLIDGLGTGESETLEISQAFGDGRHDLAVILTYEGSQASDTNDEVHEDIRVKDEEGPIPATDFLMVVLSMALGAMIFSMSNDRRSRSR